MGRGSKRRVPLEAAEQRAVVQMFDAVGFCVHQLNQERATRQTAGLFDLYAVHPEVGLAVWFDVKRLEGGDTSRAQELFAELHVQAWAVAERPAIPWVAIGSRLQAEAFLVKHGLARREGGMLELVPRRGALWREWHEVHRELRAKVRSRRRQRHNGGV